MPPFETYLCSKSSHSAELSGNIQVRFSPVKSNIWKTYGSQVQVLARSMLCAIKTLFLFLLVLLIAWHDFCSPSASSLVFVIVFFFLFDVVVFVIVGSYSFPSFGSQIASLLLISASYYIYLLP